MYKNSNNQNIWKTLSGNLLIWVLIIIMAVTALQFFSTDYKPKMITYSEFKEYVEGDIIESGKIVGRTFSGKFKEPILGDPDAMGEALRTP